MAHAATTEIIRQHLIDPEICIRCNTCEETCPIDAITHDARNYVVDPAICNGCNACISPCPTGAIDSWRQVARDRAYTLEEQLSWDTLPTQPSLEVAADESVPAEIAEITAIASAGQGGAAAPPWSAAHPYVNLHTLAKPAIPKVAQVKVVGPFGTSFLMPNHPGSSLLMVCTGTGSAPMRAMTERRRRRIAQKEGGELMLFFGARSPEELPYFGPLMKLPKDFIDINLAFSRIAGKPKQYVQDLIRERSADVARLLGDENCYIYVCGLKGMEAGVADAFRDACRQHGTDWEALLPSLREKGRYHLETY